MKVIRSTCCRASVEVRGVGYTHYYFCVECGNPCEAEELEVEIGESNAEDV